MPKRSLHYWGVSHALENLLKFTTSLPLHNCRFSNLLYEECLEYNLELPRPIRRKESLSPTLFTWWGTRWMLVICRTHLSRSCWFECLLLCVMTFKLLHKIFLLNEQHVYFILFFLSFQNKTPNEWTIEDQRKRGTDQFEGRWHLSDLYYRTT